MVGYRTKFGELNTGDFFHFIGDNGPITSFRWRKASPRDAVKQKPDGGDDTTVDGTMKVGKLTRVVRWTPDPTPEERQAFRLRVLNNTLENLIDSGRSAQADVEKLLAKGQDGWYGLFGNPMAVEAQMKAAAQLHVGLQAKKILEHAEGGFEVLQSKARENAMRYARYGHHSTSMVSNVAEEMQAAAWAEVAAMCGGL